MGPSSIMGPSLNGPKLNEGTYNSKVFKYFLVVDMSWWSHRLRHVLYRSSFPLVTSCLWAATLIGTLEWPAYAKFIGPSILSGVHFWLTNGLVFVHLEIVVAVKPFWPEVIDCLLCETFRVAQHGLMVEHTRKPCVCTVADSSQRNRSTLAYPARLHVSCHQLFEHPARSRLQRRLT